MLDESFIPAGFHFAWQSKYKKKVFNIFRRTEDICGRICSIEFAVNSSGWPITGYLEYGIPEGALIKMWFFRGYCWRTEVEA